jgi:hypothetical protein
MKSPVSQDCQAPSREAAVSAPLWNFPPVETAADLATLDHAEIVAGYMEFRPGDPQPGPNRGRAYWHGWRNAAIDHGEAKPDAASARLVHEIAPKGVFGPLRR